MAKLTISVDSSSLLKEVEELESKLFRIDKVLTKKLTLFVLRDIDSYIPVDTGQTKQSMYQYALLSEGLIQWIRKHDRTKEDVIQYIYNSKHIKNTRWVEVYLEDGGLERIINEYERLVEEYL